MFSWRVPRPANSSCSVPSSPVLSCPARPVCFVGACACLGRLGSGRRTTSLPYYLTAAAIEQKAKAAAAAARCPTPTRPPNPRTHARSLSHLPSFSSSFSFVVVTEQNGASVTARRDDTTRHDTDCSCNLERRLAHSCRLHARIYLLPLPLHLPSSRARGPLCGECLPPAVPCSVAVPDRRYGPHLSKTQAHGIRAPSFPTERTGLESFQVPTLLPLLVNVARRRRRLTNSIVHNTGHCHPPTHTHTHT